MKALMFAPAFAPYMGSESLTASKLVIALRRSGWEVDVISRVDNDLYSNQWEHPWAELIECTFPISTSRLGGLALLKERLRDTWRFMHPIQGLRWAALAYDLGRQMHLTKHYDVILSRSPPEIGHLPALFLAKEFELPWIANWNDPPLGAWPKPYEAENGSRLTQWLYRRFVRRAYSMASLNTFPSIELASHVQLHFGIERTSDSMVIPHVSLPISHRSPDVKASFILTHAGKMTGARNPINLLEGLKRFVATVAPSANEFTLQIIGHTDADFQNLADQYGLGKYLNITGPMPFTMTMETLSASTVNVLIEAPCKHGIFLAGKLSDYAQAGRPILAVSPSIGVARRLIEVHGGGLHADVASPEVIHRVLVNLYEEWQNDNLEKLYQTSQLATEFSAYSVAKAYKNAYDKIIE